MDLTVGVVSQGTAYDEVLLEMLDRLGIAFEVVSGARKVSPILSC